MMNSNAAVAYSPPQKSTNVPLRDTVAMTSAKTGVVKGNNGKRTVKLQNIETFWVGIMSVMICPPSCAAINKTNKTFFVLIISHCMQVSTY